MVAGSTIENSYSKEVPLEHRKKFAQFFTPRPVAELMAKWLLGNPKLESVFNRSGLRFIRNEAGIRNLTTFHCIYLQENLFSNITVDLLFAYLLTDTARLIFEDNCREYGNGLQKFEPNDLNKGKLLDIGKLPHNARAEMLSLYHSYSEQKDRQFVEKIDNLLLEHFAC